MEEQRLVAPPVQIDVPKGGVAFRELRVWHRCVEILMELLPTWFLSGLNILNAVNVML